MDNDTELTLLSLEDVFEKSATSGSNKLSGCLDVIKKHGKTAVATDLAIVTGALVNDTKNNESEYFLKDFQSPNRLNGIDFIGDMRIMEGTYRSSIRPVLIPASFDNYFSSNDEIVEYGEYPQEAPSLAIQEELEDACRNHNIKHTGRKYTFDETSCIKETPFSPNDFYEFEYKNKKYICVKVNSLQEEVQLSNYGKYHRGDEVWIEVSPVKWLVDYKAKKLVSSKVLLSGIRACSERTPINNFAYSEIKEYLDKYMLPEMIGGHVLQNNLSMSQTNQEIKVKKRNPYNLNLTDVSEEDIIRGAIESNIPVFLHGPSSEGKSARVKQIDSTCEIIYLRNATPESLNGKSVYNAGTGEMIDIKPTWLKKLEDKCQNEPDKLHVLFFDELTNALPSIQGMAFNIVLDREVNGIWHLPENARIVAAGNEMDDSLAANQLAEPLFNRFAHVNIKTTPESWLKWASLNNIHPAIYAYIAYKRGKALRSKYDGKNPNADPRKWEMASKVLYQTGNPKMLRSLVGEDITKEFVEFCSEEVITLEDVINGNYTTEDIQKLDTAKRYATTMGLTMVSEEHLEIVRNFTKKLGGEYRSVFDTLWTHNDESRLEKIAELKQDVSNQKESDIVIDSTAIDGIDNIELTLLSEEEIWGKKQLAALKKYGTVAGVTDFAILTGGDSIDYIPSHYDSFVKTGWFYTKNADYDDGIVIVNENGEREFNFHTNRDGCIRPVIKSDYLVSALYPFRSFGFNHVEYVLFGEYPQYAASQELQDVLEDKYENNCLVKTGRYYNYNFSHTLAQKTMIYNEYEYEDKKYIRVYTQCFSSNGVTLSNGMSFRKHDCVWVEVTPVEWIVDKETRTLISKLGLISGIGFNISDKEYDGNFEVTSMHKFMNEYMIKDIIQLYKIKEDVKRKIKK